MQEKTDPRGKTPILEGERRNERKSRPPPPSNRRTLKRDRKTRYPTNLIIFPSTTRGYLAIRFYHPIIHPHTGQAFTRQNEHHTCKLQYAPVLFIKFLSVELIYTRIHTRLPSPMVTVRVHTDFATKTTRARNPLTSTNGSKLVVCVHNE